MHEHPIEFFVELESQVWDALACGDADADRELLASDFVGVYGTGFADRSNHATSLWTARQWPRTPSPTQG